MQRKAIDRVNWLLIKNKIKRKTFVADVNMVAEPKPHQVGRKRQNVSKTGNDWDYYYDR